MFRRYVYIRVALVISEDDIEAWLVPFDQVVLEDEGFGFRVGNGYLDISDQLHHRAGFGVRVSAMKIAGHPFIEITRLADIDDLFFGVQHAINTGTMRQAGDE